MSEKVKQAPDAFGEGYNCAQAVIAAFAGSLGMDRETALRFAGGFGGGLRSGEVCGAISGAVMAIGLKYGQTDAADKATTEQCNRMTIRFMDQVRKEQGTVLTRYLLGYAGRHEKAGQAMAPALIRAICKRAIHKAVVTLETMGV